MKKKYINSDLVKLWSVLLTGILLLLFVSSEWGTVKIILACSIGGVVTFYLTMLLLICLLGMFGIEAIDSQRYKEWKKAQRIYPRRVFSYGLYALILYVSAIICGGVFTDYDQGWDGIVSEWIFFGILGFLTSQIIMRIVFLTCGITTSKEDIETMAHDIERRRSEKKELKKIRRAERRRKYNWIYRAFFAGLGFGAGFGALRDVDDNSHSEIS